MCEQNEVCFFKLTFVQNGVLHFFCLQEPIFNVLVIFFFFASKLGVYVCLVKSLLLSKQLKESSRTQNVWVKRLYLCRCGRNTQLRITTPFWRHFYEK